MENKPTEILPGIWLGDMYSAGDYAFFTRNNIKAVLNCTKDIPNFFEDRGVKYHRLNVDDSLNKQDIIDMYKGLPEAIKWIYNRHDKEGLNVYIHCHQGIQRSPTAVIAYLFHTRKRDLKVCIKYVSEKRPIVYFGGKQCNFLWPLVKVCTIKNKD